MSAVHDHIIARRPYSVGGLLALATLPIHLLLPLPWSHALAAGVLALIGGVYIGFAITDGRVRQIAIEGSVGVAFAIFSMTALLTEPWLIAIGYVAHGLWDVAHHQPQLNVTMPRWYIPACAIFDIVAGFGLLVVWLMIAP